MEEKDKVNIVDHDASRINLKRGSAKSMKRKRYCRRYKLLNILVRGWNLVWH